MTEQSQIDKKQPFLSHLKELRDRLIVCFIAIAITFIFTYIFKERIFYFLMQPFLKVMPEKSSFIFTYVTEAFITYFKIALVTAIFITSPVILYEMWMFVAPGLYEKEKKFVIPFVFLGSLCFISGAVFCYFIILPVIYKFFVGFAGNIVIPMPDLKGYMNLTLKLLIIFGFIFELPLAVFYLGKAGIINHRMLSTKRRYAILGIFILSAIITPPDISSQILIALPMWGLYELSIIITKFFGKKVPVDERV
ncbi:MAG TPA: twin-arginine translocase subunit TatC [Syntrophorhabdaceae bacterium]|nr:twin-arginine translocase subunit TatC [Syntrophorhabdaceae bacterium]